MVKLVMLNSLLAFAACGACKLGSIAPFIGPFTGTDSRGTLKKSKASKYSSSFGAGVREGGIETVSEA